MPKRVNSFIPTILSGRPIPAVLLVVAALILVATIVAPTRDSARADSTCLERPGQPAPEGARWYLRYDRAKARKCWFLGRATTSAYDVTAPQVQARASATPTLSSRLASLFGELTGSSANSAPQGNAPQSNSARAPRKPRGNSANATKTENSVRAEQRDTVEGHAGKHASQALTNAKTNALFQEFLRWREGQQNINRSNQQPPSQ
jgi:hypothetical protein